MNPPEKKKEVRVWSNDREQVVAENVDTESTGDDLSVRDGASRDGEVTDGNLDPINQNKNVEAAVDDIVVFDENFDRRRTRDIPGVVREV